MARFCIQADWDDSPHLTQAQKDALWESIPPYQRDARRRGIPQLGSGAIYPVPETEITIQPMVIQPWWKRVYGLDVGWNRTAAIWGALDVEADVLYLYAEHYRGQAEPAIHAHAVKSRGDWIPGVIDPAARGRAQRDGQQLITDYRNLGLNLMMAQNAVESGIYDVWMRLATGRLKVFSTCVNWLAEYRIYRRDKNGKVVKENDHLMDATRYLTVSGLQFAVQDPQAVEKVLGKLPRHQYEFDAFEKLGAPVRHTVQYDPFKS